MSKCVYAGSSNPITIGHTAIIDNCLKIFDEVVVVFANNLDKTDNRPEIVNSYSILSKYYAKDDRVKIISWHGAIVDLLKKENTNIYVRSVRNSIDFEYETQNFYMNKAVDKDIIEIYIPCEQDKLHISSTFVRTLASLGKPYEQYIPKV